MQQPLVSIVIDNYNYARYLGRAIESALGQHYQPHEVVVVDDASTDGSSDVMNSFGDRIVAVRHETNRGQGAAFNSGFARSRGSIVVFLDSDDYLYPGALDALVGAFSPNVVKTHGRLDLMDDRGNVLDVHPTRETRLDRGDVRNQVLHMGRSLCPVTSGNAFSRSVLEKLMPLPEQTFRISADGYVNTLAPLFGEVGVVASDESLGAYVLHGQNAWARRDNVDGGAYFRRQLEHDQHRYQVLRERAASLGLELAGDPGLNDLHHVMIRLASFCTDPAHHPWKDDTALGLAWRGMAASLEAPLPRRRRLATVVWMLLIGLVPKGLARRLILWRLLPATRSPTLDRWLKRIRRLTA